ncbi:TetR/AcrR family transcriptional regulator [Vibrio sp.]|nr:TetR/AcrR family transcriptional regulator [Vibrio sp.]
MQLKNKDKKIIILNAAEKIIADFGIQNISMQKLANEAHVAAGTIYRYFDDKEDLLTEVFLYSTRQIAAAMQQGLENEVSVEKRYRIAWLNTWHLASTNLSLLLNRVQFDSIPLTGNDELRKKEKDMFPQIELLFRDGKKNGIVKSLPNQMLITLSFGACINMARRHALGYFQLDETDLEYMLQASWDAITIHPNVEC